MNIRSWWIFSRVGWFMSLSILASFYIDLFWFKQWPVMLAGMGAADPLGFVALAWFAVGVSLISILDEDL